MYVAMIGLINELTGQQLNRIKLGGEPNRLRGGRRAESGVSSRYKMDILY